VTDEELEELAQPSESSRYWLTMIVVIPSIIVALFLVVGTYGLALLVVLSTILSTWVATEIIKAQLMGNAIRVSQNNFPHIHQIIKEIKNELGYHQKVDVFIIESGGFNLVMLSVLKRRFIILHSEMLSDGITANELRFLIARFVGYLRAKNDRFVLFRILINSTKKLMLFNLLLNPYERAVVKSGDRIGLATIKGDIDSAMLAMNKLFVGKDIGTQVSPLGVIEQYDATYDKFFPFIAEVVSSQPSLSRRYSELLKFARQKYPNQFDRLNWRPKIERSTNLSTIRREPGFSRKSTS